MRRPVVALAMAFNLMVPILLVESSGILAYNSALPLIEQNSYAEYPLSHGRCAGGL